jgi:uncharacterized membrane protein YoaK (UPF0700 family)
VAGFVDAAGCVALFGLYTAHVTGVLVSAASFPSLRLDRQSMHRLLLVPVFVLAVVAVTVFARILRRRGQEIVPALLVLFAVALAAFGLAGMRFHHARHVSGNAVLLVGATGVAAMAVQNMLMRDVLRTFSPTTIMTGNLTQCTIDLVDWVFPTPRGAIRDRESARREAGRRLRRSSPPLLCFIAGVALGGWLTARHGLVSVGLPVAAVALAAAVAWWRLRDA